MKSKLSIWTHEHISNWPCWRTSWKTRSCTRQQRAWAGLCWEYKAAAAKGGQTEFDFHKPGQELSPTPGRELSRTEQNPPPEKSVVVVDPDGKWMESHRTECALSFNFLTIKVHLWSGWNWPKSLHGKCNVYLNIWLENSLKILCMQSKIPLSNPRCLVHILSWSELEEKGAAQFLKWHVTDFEAVSEDWR